MSDSWPAVGPAHEFDAFIEPMVWGAAIYTIVRVPPVLAAAARTARTRRVGVSWISCTARAEGCPAAIQAR